MDETIEDVTYLPPIVELRKWAGHPAKSGYVPVHPTTLIAIADEIEGLRREYAELEDRYCKEGIVKNEIIERMGKALLDIRAMWGCDIRAARERAMEGLTPYSPESETPQHKVTNRE